MKAKLDVMEAYFKELDGAAKAAQPCSVEGCTAGAPCDGCAYRAHRLKVWSQLAKDHVPLTLEEAVRASASGLSAELVGPFIERVRAALEYAENLKRKP